MIYPHEPKYLLITGWIVSCLFSLNTYAQVVISQVYGGGGNSGALYTHDFIELFNAGTSPASLSGLSLQYASATGTGNFGASATQLTDLPNVTLQAGQYYLVQQASNANVGASLPVPDFIDPSPMAMAAGAGKVVLVSGITSLGCNGGSAACNTEATGRILDLVGYGTSTNYFEGSGPAPTISATLAALRAAGGCTDTNNNSADFTAAAPAPRNSSSSTNICNPNQKTDPSATTSVNPATVAPGEQALFTVTVVPGANPASTGLSVTGDLSSIGGLVTQTLFDDGTNGDATGGDNIFSNQATVVENTTAGSKTITFTIVDAESRKAMASAELTIQNTNAITPIYSIQGSGTASPLAGQMVTTTGIVTGDYQGSTGLNGFYIQDATGDGDAATSDGIFVFSNSTVSKGQFIRVTGPVREVFTQTQIGNTGDNVSIVIQEGTATLIPVNITLPVSATTDLERYEGMLVQFNQSLTATENFNLARFGEVLLSANPGYPFETDGRLYNPTNFIDPTDIPNAGVENDQNNTAAITARQLANSLHTILLDDGSNTQNPANVPYLSGENTLRIGSMVTNLTGVIGFGFNVYRIQPTQVPVFEYNDRPLIAPSTGNANIKVASFNVLNYFNGDGQGGGFPTSRGATNLEEFNRQRAKIIAALQGLNADVVGLIEMENDGDGPASAIADLVNGLNEKAGTSTYDYIRDPANGGTGTDEIKVAFIYKPGVVTPLGMALADLDPVHNRPPLAQTFKLNASGEVVTAIINHFKSKSGTGTGANADQNDGQGSFNQDRIEQAQALISFINTTVVPSAKDQDILMMGDLNAYSEEDPIDVLRAAGYISLFGPESYSYLFGGQSGSLDHALVSPSLFEQFTTGGKWHINADEPRALDYNKEFNPASLYQPNPFRSSDHDPVLAGFNLQNPLVSFAEPATATIDERDGKYTITINLSKPKLQDETITVSIATSARYGLNGKGDYITDPDGSTGKFLLAVPAGVTTATFSVIPDKNATKKKSPQTLTFTISGTSSGLAIDTDQHTFTLTITDDKLSDLMKKLLSLWPNPTNGLVNIVTALQNEPIEAVLRSPEGEVIYNGKGNAAEVSRQLTNALQSRRGGLYHIQLLIAGEVVNTRILKF